MKGVFPTLRLPLSHEVWSLLLSLLNWCGHRPRGFPRHFYVYGTAFGDARVFTRPLGGGVDSFRRRFAAAGLCLVRWSFRGPCACL